MPKTIVKAASYVLATLMKLVKEGHHQRQYLPARAEKYMKTSLSYMLPSELWSFVEIVDADNTKAVEVLGADYCKGRSKVAYTTQAYKLKGQFTDPNLWFGTVPTIGRNGEGVDEINAGCHRIASVYQFLADMLQSSVDLGFNIEKIKVPVTLNEGELSRHGQLENMGRENDSLREEFDTLLREWSTGAAGSDENRAHWVGLGFKAKPVQYGHLISIVQNPASHTLPKAVKVLINGEIVTFKRGEFVDDPSALIAEVVPGSSLQVVGKLMEKSFQAQLENARVKADAVDDQVKADIPFRMTYLRTKEVYDAIMCDVFHAATDQKVAEQPAEKRRYFNEVWQRLSAEGWDSSTSGNGTSTKSAKNEEAARKIRAMYLEGTDAEKAECEKLATMFETGEVNGQIKDFITAMTKTVSPADFYKELDEVLVPDGSEKVTEKFANKAARKAFTALMA